MPSLYQQGLPIPHDYSEFENMVLQFFNHKFNTIFQKYGRPGQKQFGIDLICNNIVVQCKNYYNTVLSIDMINTDFCSAIEHFPTIKEYYVVTTAPRDTKIQDHIRKMNNEYSITIEIYYWNVIEDFLLKNPCIKDLFYPPNNTTNQTHTFVKKVLEICYSNNLYKIFKSFDFNGPIRQEAFLSLYTIEETIENLFHSPYSFDVNPKIISIISDFYYSLSYITGTIAEYSTLNINGVSTPHYPPEKEIEIRNNIIFHCSRACQIYSDLISYLK